MKKTVLTCLFGVLATGVILIIGGATALYSGVKGVEYPIPISDVSKLEPFEDAPVSFYHDKHALALEEEGCESCHRRDSMKNFIFTYPSERDETSRRGLMDSYHDSCIGCHDARLSEGRKTGPVACGECHVPGGPQEWMKPAGLDYSMHYRHEKAMNQECGTCHHHVLNEKGNRLEYQKGQESSCRDCHRDIGDADTPSFRDAAHYGCVNCHITRKEAGNITGPISCAECHGEKEGMTAEATSNIPRPDRGQKDKIVLQSENASMKSVSFEHKVHENITTTCRSCHHETLNSCDQCHTTEGGIEGGGVTLVDAFHKKTSVRSCVGCHNSIKADASCAGCHDAMKDTSMSEDNCSTCHNGLQERMTVAKSMDKGFDLSAVLPEDYITIDVLENDYGSSKFPHSMIIGKLLDISRKNRLANPFHKNEMATCRGCHHYSSAEQTEKPPSCRSCHTIDFNPYDLGRPRLIAAYHLQCMGCHEKMGMDVMDCTSCHAAKGDNNSLSQKTRLN